MQIRNAKFALGKPLESKFGHRRGSHQRCSLIESTIQRYSQSRLSGGYSHCLNWNSACSAPVYFGRRTRLSTQAPAASKQKLGQRGSASGVRLIGGLTVAAKHSVNWADCALGPGGEDSSHF